LLGLQEHHLSLRILRLMLVWAFLGSISLTASSAEVRPERPFSKEETLEQRFIRNNEEIAKWFDSAAEGLDLFLVGQKITNRRNTSHIRLESSSVVKDREGLIQSFGIGLNLRLPNLEEFWMLKLSTFDEQKERRRSAADPNRRTDRERNYGATIGLFRKLGDIRASFEPRIELQDPLKVSHLIRFESIANMKSYEINPRLEFFANPDQGTGIFTAVNFNLILTPIFNLTFVNEGEYLEKIHQYSVTNGFSLGQVVTDRSGISYSLYFGSNNKPNYHLENYIVSVSWNKIIYRNILDCSLGPFLDFQEDKSFIGVPGAFLNFNLIF
jgi:hypothetical protein